MLSPAAIAEQPKFAIEHLAVELSADITLLQAGANCFSGATRLPPIDNVYVSEGKLRCRDLGLGRVAPERVAARALDAKARLRVGRFWPLLAVEVPASEATIVAHGSGCAGRLSPI